MSDPACRWLFLAQLAATLYMTGLIWFVQIVHYPLFGSVGQAEFTAYERRHATLTTWVVAPPMLIELATGLLLLWWRPASLPLVPLLVGSGLLAVIWLSTFAIQVPCHNQLALGFAAAVHQRLVVSNWIRTVAWTVRAGLLVWLADCLLRG